MDKKFTRVYRTLTPEQKRGYAELRQEAKDKFPPSGVLQGPSGKGHIAIAIRAARQSRGITFEQLAAQAGLDDASTVRDIEYGSDARMSDIASIATALGLRLELASMVRSGTCHTKSDEESSAVSSSSFPGCLDSYPLVDPFLQAPHNRRPTESCPQRANCLRMAACRIARLNVCWVKPVSNASADFCSARACCC